MSVLLTLIRKHISESRWMLGLSSLAFFALSIVTVWMASRFERLFESGEFASDPRRFGFLRGLGGANMDYSTTALEICWWNHPVIVLTVLSWAISRGSGAVAGEIERGTIDVTLSRPISRSTYLTSQILFAILGLLIMVAALVVGNLVGTPFFKLKSPPALLTLLKPSAIIVAMGMAVFGYTIPFSTSDVVKWRPTLFSSAATLIGLIGMSVAPQFEGYQWLEKFSVFQAYAPVTVAIKGEPLHFNSTVLLVVFSVGIAFSYWNFGRRDLPSNS